jgi:hypothetical protein
MVHNLCQQECILLVFVTGMECADDRLQMFNSSCYLFVSYPEVTWQTAQQICQGMKVDNDLQQAAVPLF